MGRFNMRRHFVILTLMFIQTLSQGSPKTSKRSIFRSAAVSADNEICSEIGKSILKKGGNAIDSIIATAICVGVVNPHSSGIGGGHFLTVYNKTTKLCTVFDARETAPLSANEEMYRNNTKSTNDLIGWLAIAVPGQVHGFWTAFKKAGGGKVSWQTLWQPTIEMCRRGIRVSAPLAKALKDETKQLEQNVDFQSNIFKNASSGEYLKENETMTCLLLAETMEKIANAEDPVQFFYDSNFTATLASEFSSKGGIITREDFKKYATKFGNEQRPPVYAHTKNGLTFCGPPPPSSASLVSSLITILDGYNLEPNDLFDEKSAGSAFHKIIEAMKFTYGVRYSFGDSDFIPSATNLAQSVNFNSYGSYVRDRIPKVSFDDPSYYGSSSNTWDMGTSHMNVVDEEGNAASMTSTINTYFGAKVMSPSSGIIYNNEMDDFSLSFASNYFNITPSVSNKLVPSKRPQSSMSPMIVFDSKTAEVRLAIGAAGGSKIISAVSQVMIRVLYFLQNIKEAIDAPRIHNQLRPFATFYDEDFSKLVVRRLEQDYLQKMDEHMSSFSSVVLGIHRLSNGSLDCYCDYRKPGGRPAGF